MIKIYGHSDDLIEIDGDISDEFGLYGDNESKVLAFSNGMLIKFSYDGEWMFSIIKHGTNAITRILPIPEGKYSQIVEIESPDIKWIVLAEHIAYK